MMYEFSESTQPIRKQQRSRYTQAFRFWLQSQKPELHVVLDENEQPRKVTNAFHHAAKASGVRITSEVFDDGRLILRYREAQAND